MLLELHERGNGGVTLSTAMVCMAGQHSYSAPFLSADTQATRLKRESGSNQWLLDIFLVSWLEGKGECVSK